MRKGEMCGSRLGTRVKKVTTGKSTELPKSPNHDVESFLLNLLHLTSFIKLE